MTLLGTLGNSGKRIAKHNFTVVTNIVTESSMSLIKWLAFALVALLLLSTTPVYAAGSGQLFSQGNTVKTLYPTTLWGSPTDTIFLATMGIGSTGTITGTPTYDGVTSNWFYYVSFNNGQSGWVRQSNLALVSSVAVCSGTPTVSFSQNPAQPSSSVQLSVGGLSNCGGEYIQIMSYQGCQSGSVVTGFTSGASGGSATVTSSSVAGQYGYWVCTNSKDTEGTLTVSGSVSFSPPPGSHSDLGFSIYTTNSSFLSLYERYYSNADSNDLLIDDAYQPSYRVYLNYWSSPQSFPRMIIGNNYTEITKTVIDGFSNIGLAKQHNFNSNDYISYDAESWGKTPSWEQDDQGYWVTQFCNAVHSAGYKCGWTPELGGGGAGQFESINWADVDMVGLLEQGRSVSTSGYGNLVANVTHLADIALAGNPNIKVWVYLDISNNPVGQKATTSQLETDITQLGQVKGVYGVTLVCQPSCNTNEMTTLVNYIKSTPSNP